MSTKNARTLSIRLDATETENLAKFEDTTGIDGVSLGRNALRACLTYFQQGGTITFPLILQPNAQSEKPTTTHASGLAADIAHLTRQKAHLNEPENQYKAAPSSQKKAS
jgi:hypothetical protein